MGFATAVGPNHVRALFTSVRGVSADRLYGCGHVILQSPRSDAFGASGAPIAACSRPSQGRLRRSAIPQPPRTLGGGWG
jgi:hypothetical protein